MTTSWSIAQTKSRLSAVVEQARREPQIITSRGKTVAVLISAEDYARLRAAADRPERSPMETFLARTAEMKGEGELEMRLPPRRRERSRRSPFDSRRS